MLDLLEVNGYRYNALDSCLIRFFESARTLNVASVIDLIHAPHHKAKLSQLEYVPTFPLLLQRSSAALAANAVGIDQRATRTATNMGAASQDASSRLAHIQRISDRQRFMSDDHEFS